MGRNGNERPNGNERELSEKMRALGVRSGEARRQRRDALPEGATEVPADIAGWTDQRLVELGGNDRNPAAAVAALRELRARAPEPERELVSGEPRGASLMDIIDLAIDWRDEAVNALAGALAEGYDADAIVTAARAKHSKATTEVAGTAGVSETGGHVVRASLERTVSSENPESGTPAPEQISNGSSERPVFRRWASWGEEGGRNGTG